MPEVRGDCGVRGGGLERGARNWEIGNRELTLMDANGEWGLGGEKGWTTDFADVR